MDAAGPGAAFLATLRAPTAEELATKQPLVPNVAQQLLALVQRDEEGHEAEIAKELVLFLCRYGLVDGHSS